MALDFLKTLDADDIFISYSREDGSAYLTGLDAALSSRGFSCFNDRRGTDAGRLPPETLFRRIRLCKTLVLLGTPGAFASPGNITPELKEFADANGTSRIIHVSFDRGARLADFPEAWHPFLAGKAREREAPQALTTGKPSDDVVAAVAKASDYMKSKDRLRKYRNRAIGVLTSLVVAIAVAAPLAFFMFMRAAAATATAVAETERAAQATGEAVSALASAVAVQAEALAARTDAEVAKADAAEQKRLAKEASADAGEQARLAGEATREAGAAKARADAEQTRAERERDIGDVRLLANRAQTILRQRPEEVSRSVQVAADSMRKSTSLGLHAVEADTALRDGLGLLPLLQWKERYEAARDFGRAVALSPDGSNFASITPDDRLRVFKSGVRTHHGERPCKCTKVALSSEPAYAAAITNEGGVKIFNLEDPKEREGRPVPLPPRVRPYDLALSPGGRYLALLVGHGEVWRSLHKLLVLDLKSDKVIKCFGGEEDTTAGVGGGGQPEEADGGACDSPLNMQIHDVAFGTNGNLAVGGQPERPQGGRPTGRVIIWPLLLIEPGEENERDLTTASFPEPLSVSQREAVSAVAPGDDETYFATEKGVWKRMSGQAEFTPVSRLPRPGRNAPTIKTELDPATVMSDSRAQIYELAFAPGGRSLSLVRYPATLEEEETGEAGNSLEVWDSTGHRDSTEAFHPVEIKGLGFRQGGRQVVTVTGEMPAYLASDRSELKGELRLFGVDDGSRAEGTTVERGADGEMLLLSPYTGHVVTAEDKAAAVWDVLEKKKREARFGPALGGATAAALSPDAQFLALAGKTPGGDGWALVVYHGDSAAFTELRRLPPNVMVGEDISDKPSKMSVSSDGRVAAVLFQPGGFFPAGDNYIRIYDTAVGLDVTPKSLREVSNIAAMTLGPGGRLFAVAEFGGQARLIDLTTRRSSTLVGDTKILSLAFSPDGRYLGLGSEEGLLHVFELGESVAEVARLQHTGKVTAIAFSDDGARVATTSSDPHPNEIDEDESYPMRVWLLRPSALLDEAEARLDALRRLER